MKILELQWHNKNKSLLIDYNNGYKIKWVPKDSSLINEERKLIPLDNSIPDASIKTLFNSMIIGDNLFVLNTLITYFNDLDDKKKVKFVYIDPPYNTFNSELTYKDSLKHDEWLTFILDRLERIKKIIRSDGVVCVQIDDREFARLYLLLAEMFGEKNLKTVVVKMSELSGLKMQTAKLGGIPKLKEYLILAKLDGLQGFHFESLPKTKWDPEYNLFIKNYSLEDKKRIMLLQEKENITPNDLHELDLICKNFELIPVNKALEEQNILSTDKLSFFNENAWRICRTASSSSIFKLTEEKKNILSEPQQIFSVLSKKGKVYLVKSDYTADARKPRVQILFADEHLTTPLGDLWTDIKTTGLEFEGEIDFKNGKKPEKLIKRLIEGITNEGDLVLDLFGGSGTTASICIETNRKFINIEVSTEIFNLAVERIANKKKKMLKNTTKKSDKVYLYKLASSKLGI